MIEQFGDQYRDDSRRAGAVLPRRQQGDAS
jgi:hypothetical protein